MQTLYPRPPAPEASARHALRVKALIEFLQRDQARLLNRKQELESHLREAGLETPEAIQAICDLLGPLAPPAAGAPAATPLPRRPHTML